MPLSLKHGYSAGFEERSSTCLAVSGSAWARGERGGVAMVGDERRERSERKRIRLAQALWRDFTRDTTAVGQTPLTP